MLLLFELFLLMMNTNIQEKVCNRLEKHYCSCGFFLGIISFSLKWNNVMCKLLDEYRIHFGVDQEGTENKCG